MTSITLPEKLTSSSVDELTGLLASCTDDRIEIDGRNVRMIGAQAAECLARFIGHATTNGAQVTIDGSADMRDDLRLLGLDTLVLKGEN